MLNARVVKCSELLNVLKSQTRFISYESIVKERNEIFDSEKRRQREEVGRIEKIEVRYLGLPQDTTLIMNKGLSTPYNCAQHLSEMHCKKSAIALIDSTVPWDMHRPLVESCTLQLLNFTVVDPHLVNKAFWRSCSFMLGAALHKAFKDDVNLLLHSFPSPIVRSGSFVHDFGIDHKDWTPNTQELRALSSEMVKIANRALPIERLDINIDTAFTMFRNNAFKTEQIPSIAQQSGGLVTVYRIDDHIDMSRGPMIANSSLLGKCTISAVHKIVEDKGKMLYRAQGVALPTGIIINHFAYGILEDRSKKLNPAKLPNEQYEDAVVGQMS